MKPKIIWLEFSGEWACKLRGTITGYGNTPELAYNNWKWLYEKY